DVYNQDYYYKNNPSIQSQFKATDGNGLIKNFVESGMAKGLRGSANFDVNSYRLQYPDLRIAFGNNLKAYYMHYITNGKKEGRKATGTTQMVGYVTKLNGVDYSSVYDFNYYINKYSDLKKTAALQHFVTFGMKESRRANASFILSYYRANYPDLRKAFGNNNAAYYLHYVTYGKREGRVANRLLPPSKTTNNSNSNTRPTAPTNDQSNQNVNIPKYEISGTPNATEEQMVKYFLSKIEFPDFYSTNDSEVKTINDFVHVYYEEATAEGIRPEVAFAQMCNETGFLQYTGRVKIEQYNFAGLGAIDRDQSSNSFSSVREGIRAQIQHLKAYAVKNPTLKYQLVDARYKYVTKGSAQYVEWLGTNENPTHNGWATTHGYGNALRKIIDEILATK
uniref:glucosaminidase domain-containing protein n=1 Tax=Sharpea azabuensis TaxID=322505 RepID=UPI001563F925